jgi:hypothetical protein
VKQLLQAVSCTFVLLAIVTVAVGVSAAGRAGAAFVVAAVASVVVAGGLFGLSLRTKEERHD